MPEEELTGDTPPDGNEKIKDDKMVTMTQEDLNRSHAERADRAAKAAVSKLLGDMGYDDTDSLKEALGNYKTYLDSQKSTQEKLESDLAAANAKVVELAADLADALVTIEEQALKSSLANAAREMNFLPESLDDVWMFVSSDNTLKNGLKYDEGTKQVSGAKAVVKSVAEKRPHWVQTEIRKGTPSPRGAKAAPPKVTPGSNESPEPLVRF